MTRKDNLIALRDAVVDGQRDFPKGLRSLLFGHKGSAKLVADAYNGDMNAALAFVAEVLPGWFYLIGSGPIGIGASVTEKKGGHNYSGEADTPARALLIAALNALIEMEQDT